MSERTRPPRELKEMFPQIDPKRVEDLIINPNFQARQALYNLNREIDPMIITSKKGEGLHLKRVSTLLVTIFSPGMTALHNELKQEKYEDNEITAAELVADNQLKLP